MNIFQLAVAHLRGHSVANAAGRLSVKLPIPGIINIALTTLDQEPDEDVGVHINLESKAPWQTVGDARPQYESFPPDMQELFQKLLHEKG